MSSPPPSGRFASWLAARQALLGIASAEALADLSGLSQGAMEKLLSTASLAGMGRGARAALARALKVTVRDLEAVGAGRIEWIDDARQVDWDRLTPDPLRVSRPSRDPTTLEARWCPPERGVPVVGQIVEGGIARFFESVASSDSLRLPVRYPGAPDAFALAAICPIDPYPIGAALVFRGLPPGQIERDQLVLISTSEGITDALLCQAMKVSRQVLSVRRFSGDELAIPLETILRAAVVLAAHLSQAEKAPL